MLLRGDDLGRAPPPLPPVGLGLGLGLGLGGRWYVLSSTVPDCGYISSDLPGKGKG